MISDKDRSGWFGASDVRYIMGNWSGKSFDRWWCTKLGIGSSNFTNEAMQTGTAYEHQILDALGIPEKDRQFFVPELLLRVNLDGNDADTIYEVKTFFQEKGFRYYRHYWEQIQVQMFASGFRRAKLIAYGLTEKEYKNFFLPIDPERIDEKDVLYDIEWVQNKFMPKIEILSNFLRDGRFP